MFVRDGAVTPGPSRECDIAFFVKRRPKSARQSRDSTVAARRVQSVTVPSSRVSRECRSPGLRSPPPLKKCPKPISGKKRHININFLAGDRLVGGESPDGVSRSQRFMCYLRNPRTINLLVRAPDREDR